MASIDDELLLDEQENRREIAFIRRQLPSELKERWTDDDLQWMLDTIVDYYVESGVLDTDADEVDIDLELAAQHVCRQAEAEHRPALEAQDVFFVVEADLDFQEQNL
ncbi:MAG: hypothetical protein IJV45_01815 [Prevotella sp.]|nr:hypothetical protein [Prevotella sp.]